MNQQRQQQWIPIVTGCSHGGGRFLPRSVPDLSDLVIAASNLAVGDISTSAVASVSIGVHGRLWERGRESTREGRGNGRSSGRREWKAEWEMKDTVTVALAFASELDYNFFAVYDGHNEAQVAHEVGIGADGGEDDVGLKAGKIEAGSAVAVMEVAGSVRRWQISSPGAGSETTKVV